MPKPKPSPLSVRLSADLLAALKQEALRRGVTVNAFVVGAVSRAMQSPVIPEGFEPHADDLAMLGRRDGGVVRLVKAVPMRLPRAAPGSRLKKR